MIDRIEHKLRIKYGLRDYPTPNQLEVWLRLVETLIAKGHDPEEAGREAAIEAFGGVDQVLLFSEADTIGALLARARGRD